MFYQVSSYKDSIVAHAWARINTSTYYKAYIPVPNISWEYHYKHTCNIIRLYEVHMYSTLCNNPLISVTCIMIIHEKVHINMYMYYNTVCTCTCV